MKVPLNLLIDTHILLWSLGQTSKLSTQAYELIQSPENQVWVSAISLWEIAIKVQAGKLKVPDKFDEYIPSQGFELLPFSTSHAMATLRLPLYHKDPFDRALLSQSQLEKFKFLTADRLLLSYKEDADIIFMG